MMMMNMNGRCWGACIIFRCSCKVYVYHMHCVGHSVNCTWMRRCNCWKSLYLIILMGTQCTCTHFVRWETKRRHKYFMGFIASMKLYCLPTNFYLKKSVLLPGRIPFPLIKWIRWGGMGTQREKLMRWVPGTEDKQVNVWIENDFRYIGQSRRLSGNCFV